MLDQIRAGQMRVAVEDGRWEGIAEITRAREATRGLPYEMGVHIVWEEGAMVRNSSLGRRLSPSASLSIRPQRRQ
jgi:hypothetical protein